MKSLSLILVAILLVTASWVTPTAQPVSKEKKISTATSGSFSFFRTHRQAKGITATWGLVSNIGVTGFIVQQTYEDPTDPYANWADIATIPFTDNRSFKYTDPSVFPGYVSYRIVVMNGFSIADISEVSTVHIIQH